ncbi:unnamed protein product [Auanema sp. JU1783]|nr:unnamed protein product [Auanema sp. JU1783]
MRNNIELICDDLNNCTLIKSEELPFNPLQTSFCSVIKFRNSTIGKLQLNVLSNTFTCKKITQGFTRITNLTIHSIARCIGTGDCPLGTGCDDIRQNTFVKDLIQTYDTPGHTYCTRAGGGIFNSCGLPIEGCLLFRPTYVPETTTVYEEVKCAAWTQEINIHMRMEYYNNTHEYEFSLQPYRKYEIHGITLQISSISTQVLPELLNQVFLVSKSNSLMVPENKKPAIICNSQQTAALDFKNCHIRKPCVCLAAAAQLSCNCDSATRRELERFKLPKNAPNYDVLERSNKIKVISFMEETTVTLENPNYSIENLYTNRHPCFSDFQVMNGCYNCRDGVELNMTCDTKDELYAILNCESFSKPVICSDKNPTTTIRFFHNLPTFEENCTLTCGKAPKQQIRLSARLHYIFDTPMLSEPDINQHNGTSGIAWDWPNMGPMMDILFANWKWIVPTVAAVAAVIYFAGTSAAFLLPTLGPAIMALCCLKRANSIPPPAVSGNA